MLEVVLRTLIIYLALLLTMGLLGKRMNAQLNVAELSLMIMLGGVGSVAMQLPDRGLLFSIPGENQHFSTGCSSTSNANTH
jgi:uncharacterized membrane protein YcaP (DUF421 family)